MEAERKVSVIILNYNGQEHIEPCLSSLLGLVFPAEQLEIIFVDNGSTDGSVSLVQSRFPAVRILANKTNVGFSKAANQAASLARGKYVAFLNNDMRVDRDWLRVLVETIDGGDGYVCVGSRVLNWEGTAVDFAGRHDDAFCLNREAGSNSSSDESADSSSVLSLLFVSGGAMLIQRSLFQQVGGFDPDFFLYHEDVDLGWRLWLRGYECVLAPRSVVYHRGGASSRKLPDEYIQKLSQTHTLFSAFKNLDAGNLKRMLPLLLYLFLDRGRTSAPAMRSLTSAIRDFRSGIASFASKREEAQRARVRSDEEIFALVGHPFGFLARQPWHRTVQEQLKTLCSDLDFDTPDAESVRAAFAECLDAARSTYESNLAAELDELATQMERALQVERALLAERASQADAAQTHDLIIRRLQERLERRDNEIQSKDSLLKKLETEAQMTEAGTRKLAALCDSLRTQAAEKEETRLRLSSELSAKSEQLDRITRSLGWRLLERYGRVKYRYLLPIYRLFNRGSAKHPTLPSRDRSAGGEL